MTGQDFKVPPRSWRSIQGIADNVRSEFRLGDEPYFPIMDLLEKILDQQLGLIRLEVGSISEMNGAEGHTDPNGAFIELREDVYELALRGDGRARFTAAHELGHWIMHTDIPLARARPEDNVRPYRLSEPQANQFAAELLMPPKFFNPLDNEKDVMVRHGVSHQAASHRLSYLESKGML